MWPGGKAHQTLDISYVGASLARSANRLLLPHLLPHFLLHHRTHAPPHPRHPLIHHPPHPHPHLHPHRRLHVLMKKRRKIII